MKKRKYYNIEKLLGVNLSEGQGSGENPSYLRNMIIDDGITKKRKGWRVLYNFRTYSYESLCINGIYEYKGKNKSCLIVHAGTELYECSYDLKEINQIPKAEGVEIKSKKSMGQMHAGVLWISGVGQLVFYDGSKIQKARESSILYVPTTASGITDLHLGLEYTKREYPNQLTGRRINTLRGVKSGIQSHRFLLDTKAAYGKPFSLTASFRVKRSEEIEDDYTTSYIGLSQDGEEISSVITTRIYTESLTDQTFVARSAPVDASGNYVIMEDVKLACKVINGNELYLDFDAISYQKGRDNITVEFTEAQAPSDELDNVELFASTTLKIGDELMLAACGSNKLYCSWDKDGLVYFPRGKVISIGQGAEKIQGVLPMTEDYVAVYKRNSFYRLKINPEEQGVNELFPSLDTQGAINPFVVKRLGYDCLSFDKEGIFGVGDTENDEYVTNRLYKRSTPIDKELKECHFKENACACVHKDTYYLFLDGKVYVANGQCKTKGGDDFLYEWWVFDGCEASCAASINGTLYMGRQNGDIAIFDEEYTDRYDYVLTERERDFVFQEGSPTKIAFNYAINVENGDKIGMDSHYVKVAECQYLKSNNMIYLPLELFLDKGGYVNVFENMDILLVDEQRQIVYEGKLLQVIPSENGIYCRNLDLGEDAILKLYVRNDYSASYTLKQSGTEYELYWGDVPVELYSLEIDRVYIKHKKEIVCELCTPITDLGIKGEKTLCGIVFKPSRDTRCSLRIGYETSRNAFSKELTIGSFIDFEAVDFEDFEFSPRFSKSIRINCLERNFDHIRVWLYSDKGREVGIDSLTLIYE